jgi:hypothetical protein
VQPVAVALGSVDATAARSRGQGMSEGGGGNIVCGIPGSNIVCGGCRGEDDEHQGREERGVGGGGRGDAKISLIGDIHLENKWTQFIKNEISSVEQAGADVRDSSNSIGGSREKALGGADAGRGARLCLWLRKCFFNTCIYSL